jgi:hypothetical protein
LRHSLFAENDKVMYSFANPSYAVGRKFQEFSGQDH